MLWDFFLLFLLLRKWEPVEKEPKFSARSDQYSSVAIFTDFANLLVKFPFSLIFKTTSTLFCLLLIQSL